MLKLRFKNRDHKDVWLVEPKVAIGKALGNQVLLTDAGIKDQHVVIEIAPGEKLTLVNIGNDPGLKLNGSQMATRHELNIRDIFTLGNGIEMQVIDPRQETLELPEIHTMAAGSGAAPAISEEDQPWVLRATAIEIRGKTYPITGTKVLGRSKECDITIPVTHLSRKHAELSVVRGKLVVKDLNSSNGTFINGRRLTAPTVISKGDELRLDTVAFIVEGGANEDESDKTSVRAAVSLPPAAAVQSRPTTKVTHAAAPAAANRAEPAAASSGGKSGLLIVAVLVLSALLVGAVLLFK